MPGTVDSGLHLVGAAELEAVATKELHRSRRYGRSFSVAIFAIDDLDGLARGTSSGAAEAAARALASAVARVVRDADTLARASGAELHALLPETDRFGARMLMRRAWNEIRREPAMRAAGGLARRRVAMGAASFPRDGEELGALLEACRRSQGERRSSMLFDEAAGLEAAPSFWALADALLDGAPIPAGSPSARLPLDPELFPAVKREAAREIGRDPRARGALYLAHVGAGAADVTAALPRLEGSARQGDTASRVYVLGPRATAQGRDGEHPLVTCVSVEGDRRLLDHAFLLLLSEVASYALLQGPDGRLFHSSDAPLVDALVASLQAQYELPPA